MAEYTDFENKYRSYTGFTYDGIKAFDKLEKNEKLADRMQWYVPGGVGMQSRNEFVATVKEHFGKVQTPQTPEDPEQGQNQADAEEQKKEEPTDPNQENVEESSTAEVKE